MRFVSPPPSPLPAVLLRVPPACSASSSSSPPAGRLGRRPRFPLGGGPRCKCRGEALGTPAPGGWVGRARLAPSSGGPSGCRPARSPFPGAGRDAGCRGGGRGAAGSWGPGGFGCRGLLMWDWRSLPLRLASVCPWLALNFSLFCHPSFGRAALPRRCRSSPSGGRAGCRGPAFPPRALPGAGGCPPPPPRTRAVRRPRPG